MSLSGRRRLTLVRYVCVSLGHEATNVLITLFAKLHVKRLYNVRVGSVSLVSGAVAIGGAMRQVCSGGGKAACVRINPPGAGASTEAVPVPSLLVGVIGGFCASGPGRCFLANGAGPARPEACERFFSQFLGEGNLRRIGFRRVQRAFTIHTVRVPRFSVGSLSRVLNRGGISFALGICNDTGLRRGIGYVGLLGSLLWGVSRNSVRDSKAYFGLMNYIGICLHGVFHICDGEG